MVEFIIGSAVALVSFIIGAATATEIMSTPKEVIKKNVKGKALSS